ncbi:MAG: YegP family protein [Verrucomicrobiae bacterium]|nr:YegP family protein [Verrucomicrobiae bacterium]
MPGKFEIKKAKNGQFYFHLKASNGEIILASETYKTKRSARNGIASVQKNSADGARFDRRKGKGDKPYFVLKAANHQVIGQSEMYESDKAMENGIKSVQNNAGTTKVEDLS